MRIQLLGKSLWRGQGERFSYFDLLSISGYLDRLFGAKRLTLALTVCNFEVAVIIHLRWHEGCR